MDIRRYFGSSPNVKTKSSTIANKESTSSVDSKPTSSSTRTRSTKALSSKSKSKNKQIVIEEDDDIDKTRKKMSRKRTALMIESDDDDDDDEDPIPPKRLATRRTVIEDSDDDDDFSKRKQPIKLIVRQSPRKKAVPATTTMVVKPLKIVTADEFYGGEIVKREKRTSKLSKIKSENVLICDDDEFVETLKCDAESVKVKSPNKKQTTPVKKPLIEIHKESAQPIEKKRIKEIAVSDATPSSGEKRRGNYLAFMQYKNRSGPQAPGSKQIPQGSEGCLDGLHFVVTGVLESLERNETVDLIKTYGGKLQSSVCKSTDYMVVGQDAGPSKLEKAEKLKVKQISEDDFLNLIATLPSKLSSIEPIRKLTESKSISLKPKCSLNMEMVEKSMSSNDCSTSRTSTNSNEMNSNLMWVDKYKPKTIKQIIGQNGDKSNVNKLIYWLNNWNRNHSNIAVKSKSAAAAAKWKSDDGSSFKAALLSGPPGVGKTTSAQLVCKELGFTYVELNASDTRSKRSLQEVVAELLRNKSLTHYVMGNPSNASKHCLLMDEVDGMAGNEDRGGIQELIQLIKNSKIPVICMCNDRNHQKIRSLANYCFDLRFQKPRVEQLKGAFMSICFKEGLEISSDALQEVIIGANQDVRQVLNHLSMWSVKSKKISIEVATLDAKLSKKDLKIGPFDVLKTVFSESDQKKMTIHDKSDLFFHDYSLSPLFVFENYLSVVPHAAQNDLVARLRLLSSAADSISKGDLVEKLIRSEGHWSLLPVQAIFASVIPGDVLAGHIGQMINFPSWLGRNSTRGKNDRILQQLHMHTRLRTSGNKTDLNADYLEILCDSIVRPLVSNGQDGVPHSVNIMNEYNLLREDLDSIIDVTMWPNQLNPLTKLSSQLKSSFTRTYNKTVHTNPYSAILSTTSKVNGSSIGGGGNEFDETIVEDEEDIDMDNEEDITKDAMIKAKICKRKSKVTADPGPSSMKSLTRKKRKL